MDVAIIAFICIFIGVATRMIVPALRKYKDAMKNDEEFHWNHKYTVTAILSFIIALATTAIGLNLFSIPESYDFVLRVGTAVYGFGLDGVIIELTEW